MTVSPLAWVDHSDRRRLVIDGPDRHKFLHNLTTNEIKRLPIGTGCETFVTSPQGKTLAYILVHNLGDSLLIRAERDGAEALDAHLAKYRLFDDVTVRDDSDRTCEFHLFGPDLATAIGLTLPAGADYASDAQPLDLTSVRVIRESPTGAAGMTLVAPIESRNAVLTVLRPFGESSDAAFEFARVAAGTPRFGRDVMPENLPQEVGRDARAINFVKGCYLGQETVARIDALGHVNKILKGLIVPAGATISAGSTLSADDKTVGTVTSVATDPRTGRSVAMGYVRVLHAAPGTALRVVDSSDGTAVIVSDFPIAG